MHPASRLLKFAVVGVIGFAVDASVLHVIALAFGVDPYTARAASYLCAATTTWWLNRRWTFASRDPGIVQEWARFVSVNLSGGIVNYTVYAVLVALFEWFTAHLAVAVAIGSLSGMIVNFKGSQKLVFNSETGSLPKDA